MFYYPSIFHIPGIMHGALIPSTPQIFPLSLMLPVQQFWVPPGLLVQPPPPQLQQVFAQHTDAPIPSYSAHGSKMEN